MSNDKISIWVGEIVEGKSKAALPELAKRAVTETAEISGDVLRENIRRFVASFAPLLNDNKLDETNVVIDEIELSLAVSASGSIELLSKLSAGTEASVKVKLKRDRNLT